jgi:hypothetical protein
MNTTTAIIINNTGIEVRRFPNSVAHTDIHEIVGGWFDCVRTDTLIGYVHDTGLIDGQHINFIATALFGRILCGTCVVFGAMNEDGEYDGYDHEVSIDDLMRIKNHASTYSMWVQAVMEKA